MASLRDAPLPIVKSVTNDIRVPADAEYVIEGYLGERRLHRARRAVRRVPRLLRRREDQPGLPRHRDHAPPRRALPNAEHQRQDAEPHRHRATHHAAHRSAGVARARERDSRTGRGLRAAGDRRRVQRPHARSASAMPGEARNAIAAVFACMANVKNVFVVDPDIDIFSDEQMEWALATRFQPDRDVYRRERLPRLAARSVARRRREVGSKAGFDLTLPFGGERGFEAELAGAADVRRAAFPLGARRARRRAEVLRGTDGRGRQRRRPRDRS